MIPSTSEDFSERDCMIFCTSERAEAGISDGDKRSMRVCARRRSMAIYKAGWKGRLTVLASSLTLPSPSSNIPTSKGKNVLNPNPLVCCLTPQRTLIPPTLLREPFASKADANIRSNICAEVSFSLPFPIDTDPVELERLVLLVQEGVEEGLRKTAFPRSMRHDSAGL